MPTNWSAYEDIADFFSNDVKELDGKKVYGHMDYGKKDPSLGWRFTCRRLRVADDARRWAGPHQQPAAVYALTKYVDWMKKYAPQQA